jgi:ABC-type sugar transport system ATPase subunit
VARCLARGARVLLLDAPLAYLDAARRAEVRALTVGLLQRAGTTSIYATHDRAEAAAVGGRVAVMRGGRIEQVGRYEDLHRRPATTFVAGFVGVPAINLLAGVVVPEGLRLAPAAAGPSGSARANPWTISLPPAIAAQVPPGTPLTVGIRAEAFRLAPDGDEGLPARVVDGGRPLGHERYLVTCALGTPAAPGPEIVAELRVPAGQALPVDAPLRLAVDSGQVHLFDAAGNCIDALDAHHTGDAAAPRVPGAGLRA